MELAAFHPARIALAVLAGLALLTLIFSARIPGGARRAGEIYRRHFAKPHRERQLVTAIAFYVTFAVVRILTHAIRAGRGPFHNLEVGGRHIHHLVWGILLLLIVGYGWLLQFGTDMQGKSRWAGRLTAFLFGVGAALTLGTLALTMNYNLDLSGSLNPVDKFSVQAKFDLGDSGRLAREQEAEALYLQGVEEFANGNYDKAIALWEQVLKLDPKYQPAADNIRTVQHTMALQEQTETVTPK